MLGEDVGEGDLGSCRCSGGVLGGVSWCVIVHTMCVYVCVYVRVLPLMLAILFMYTYTYNKLIRA